MKIRLLALTIMCLLCSRIAMGANSCDRYPEVTRAEWPYFIETQCDCGKSLRKKYGYSGNSDKTLVAVCNFRKSESGDAYGGFFFRGTAKVRAPVERQEYANGADLYFGGMKFVDEEKAINAFKAPPLNNSVGCWVAQAEVEIKKILIMLGPGTDEDGEWLLDYRVTHVGKYTACAREGME